MTSITKLIKNVQFVHDFQEGQKSRKEKQGNIHASKKHERTASEMKEVINFLRDLPQDEDGDYAPSSHPITEKPQEINETMDLFSFSESDISRLPATIVESLQLSPSDKLENKIIELIKIANRPLNVRELIIGLYKKYEYEVTDRNPFSSKLYRMTSAGKISPVSGKKGYYALPAKENTLFDSEGDI